MTSSQFGATNYLDTDADLTESVNKQIDANIKDTQEFYQQMQELEKQRYEQRDKNLELLTSFVKTAAPIVNQIKQANEDRNLHQEYLNDYTGARDEVLEEQERIEAEQRSQRNEEKQFAADAEKQSKDPKQSKEDREIAADAANIFTQGSFQYAEGLNSVNNAKAFSGNYSSYLKIAVKDGGFAALDNRILNDNLTRDEAREHTRELRKIIFQNYIRARRAAGLRPLTKGEIRKYIAPEVRKAEQNVLVQWSENRQKLTEQATAIRNSDEVSSMFANKATLANDMLGKEGWITSRKAELVAAGEDTSFASQKAFDEFGDIVEPLLKDVASGVDSADIRSLLDTEFEFPGGKMKLNDPRAPKGAQRLHQKLTNAAVEYDANALEQEEDAQEQEMMKWKDTSHVDFVKSLNELKDPRQQAGAVDEYVLEFRKKFNIVDDEALPDFMKDFLTSRQFSDESIVVEIRSRRRNNLPITQSMIDKIADPDIRDEQAKFINTPELGAFTEDEAQDLETEKIPTIVRDAKQLTDLNKAKTDKFLVARDNAKEYITARFKELVVGGQSRTTALTNAIREAKGFLKDGTFDKEEILPIDTQATKDLAATLNALGKDPSLIYSTEEWAGEAPHLAIAREYIRSGGKTRYPSYYMRFNFIKNGDNAYLTPEEIFKARVAKVDKKEEDKTELPERKELDNVDDQNKLLNKNNGTKTLDVALKNDNIQWMIKSSPTFSEINAEAFLRQIEVNIQDQQAITGIAQEHKRKTTLSKEDSDKLLEAVPELKEAPFLNPNTLSPAAINAMLKLNI